MGIGVKNIIPDAEMLLGMQPEEIAGPLLECINLLSEGEQVSQLHRNGYIESHAIAYPQQYRQAVAEALMEAWVWLEAEGLLAPRTGIGNAEGWVFITRRGKSLKGSTDLRSFVNGNMLPRQQLHPLIASRVWPNFIRGDYEAAVFQAFKEIEVAVRKAGGFSDTDIGTALMRKAFDENNGPLTDPNLPVSERQALGHLFHGAIGRYKNPGSHRAVVINDPREAVEMIMLASLLLRIVAPVH